MRVKKHMAFMLNFVSDFADGKMSRFDFDLDYSAYVIEHFPEMEKEHPRLARRFADTIDCVFRRHPDTDFGNIRTAYRNDPDSVSETSGHLAWLTT